MITKVNVTPIIRVALVLSILLVTAPMMSVADLPGTCRRPRPAGRGRAHINITISSNGQYAVDGTTVHQTSAGDSRRLAEPGNAAVPVVVRADTGGRSRRSATRPEDARAAAPPAIATRQRTDVKP